VETTPEQLAPGQLAPDPLESEVLVIGGGPAGLAAAIAARQKGFRVVVVDSAQRPPIDKACGEGLMPDALDALAGLGVHIPPEAGGAFRGIRFLGAGVSVDAEFPRGPALAVRRTTLHQLLFERATEAGVEFAWGMPVKDLTGISARWIIGADGHSSVVRRWSGLERWRSDHQRYGFRVHYRIRPWADYVEVYWHPQLQIYVAPVGAEEVLVALLCRDSHLRVEDGIACFPELEKRLANAPLTSSERGGISGMRKLWVVTQGTVALVGDAAGSVDAITGEGLGLAFRQALVLADALMLGDLDHYEIAHQRMLRRPWWMARLLLLLDGRPGLQREVLWLLARHPDLFRFLLALHVGQWNPFRKARQPKLSPTSS
jgi:menaquinone-9 beta-reductase